MISNGYSELTGGNSELATVNRQQEFATRGHNDGQHESEEEATINQLTGGNVRYLLLYFVSNEKLSRY